MEQTQVEKMIEDIRCPQCKGLYLPNLGCYCSPIIKPPTIPEPIPNPTSHSTHIEFIEDGKKVLLKALLEMFNKKAYGE